jgi:ribosomal protein L21E
MRKFNVGDRVIIVEAPTEIPNYKSHNYVGEVVTITSLTSDGKAVNIRLDNGDYWGVYAHRVEPYSSNYFEVDL